MNTIIWILIIIVIIAQLITFYAIILLNQKVSRFEGLEQRQNQLMKEMDDAIGVYLIEMREENDRLVQQLVDVRTQPTLKKADEVKTEVENKQIQQVESFQQRTQPAVATKTLLPKQVIAQAYSNQQLPKKEASVQSPVLQNEVVDRQQPTLGTDSQMFRSLKSLASNGTFTKAASVTTIPENVSDNFQSYAQTLEEQVIDLHQQGYPIEEIAQKMQKGTTEIELLLKFHT